MDSSSLDSTLFGHLKLDHHVNIKQVVQKVRGNWTMSSLTLYSTRLSSCWSQVYGIGRKTETLDFTANSDTSTFCSKTILKVRIPWFLDVSHPSLYNTALNWYQKYFAADKNHWKVRQACDAPDLTFKHLPRQQDPCFLYGLGLVYFHFSAHRWWVDLTWVPTILPFKKCLTRD